METKIIASEIIQDGENITKWTLHKGKGIIDLEKLIDDSVVECDWLGDDNNFLQVMYSEWNSMEHFAIISAGGQVVKKGITEIHHYIEQVNLFVVMFTGFGLGENDATFYNVAHDDFKMAVIDSYGDFILEPTFTNIKYFDDEDVFYADGNIYDFNGKFIKKDT